MRENRSCGSEGGEGKTFPTPIRMRSRRMHLKDQLFITGDIISPIDVEWNALK